MIANDNEEITPTQTTTTTTARPSTTAAPRRSLSSHNNNGLSINRSVVESSRLNAVNSARGGRRPPQRRPGLDAIKPNVDRFEHHRPLVPVSNSISNGPVRSISREPVSSKPIHSQPAVSRSPITNPIAASILATYNHNNNLQPGGSLVPNTRPIVPVSNSIAVPNNSPINSLISNPISSSIPINHLAPANSFFPINNNLVNSGHPVPISPPTNPAASPAVVAAVSPPAAAISPVSNPTNGGASPVNNAISGPAANPNSITNNAITKPVLRGRQNAGILEYQLNAASRPERPHVRPRPERVHETHNAVPYAGRAGSRASSRARVTIEPPNEPSAGEEASLPNGGSGFGQRIRG